MILTGSPTGYNDLDNIPVFRLEIVKDMDEETQIPEILNPTMSP